MFNKTDRILVAVSGGKDSLSLWYVLSKLGYIADALHINLGISDYSRLSQEKAQKLAERISRNLHIVNIEEDFGKTIPEASSERKGRPPCSLCGTLKRYYMNLYAKKLGYRILATAHNLDDEVTVLLLNTLNWNVDYLARQHPVLPEEKGFVKKVKPFCKMSEKEVAMYAILNEIDYIEEECPFAEGSTTISYKKILSKIEEISPGTKIRFYLEFISRIYPMISDRKKKTHLNECKICGEPTQAEVCPVCRFKASLFR